VGQAFGGKPPARLLVHLAATSAPVASFFVYNQEAENPAACRRVVYLRYNKNNEDYFGTKTMKIIYEDENLMVVEKTAGLLTHPAFAKAPAYALRASADKSADKPAGDIKKPSVSEWLIKKYPQILKHQWPEPDRPGIVHRLDENTSGLLVLAKNPVILKQLQNQWKRGLVKKEYLALVVGNVRESGEIVAFVGRHRGKERQVASFIVAKGRAKNIKMAKTRYDIVRHFRGRGREELTLLKVMPETGRTHQIRVHLQKIGYPILGDPQYNTKISRQLNKKIHLFRQFLHASRLEFENPKDGQKMILVSKLPKELEQILKQCSPIS
jgi:23S rRNA pseudouridine1911/1915/1917 synthase